MLSEWILLVLFTLLFLGAIFGLRWGDDKRALVDKDHWKFKDSEGSGV